MLHHVSVEVPAESAEESARFWEALGFERVEPPDVLTGHVVWFERKNTQIHLILCEGGSETVPPLGHAAVVADDLDAAVERLRAGGFDVEPHRELWGARRWFATGPGGHKVEVMEFAPGGGR